MRARAALIAIALVVSGCGPGLPDSSKRAESVLSPLYDAGAFSGAVIIGRGGDVIYEASFGIAEGETPFRLSTTSDGASLAKTMTAAAVLLLAGESGVDLDAPAQRYAAEFPYPDITVRALLSHSAGLPDYDHFAGLLEAGDPVTTTDLLEALAEGDSLPAFPPGSAFSYCNLCYDALGLVVERAAGQPLPRVLDERFFSPLGMENAFLRPARFSDWPVRRTTAFQRRSDCALEEFGAFDNEGFHGGSNIYFSARDLHAWASAWVASRALPDRADMLAREPARIAEEDSGLTLGSWYCDGRRPRCYYTGHHRGFFGLVYWNRETGATVSLVSNIALSPHLKADLPRALVAIAENEALAPEISAAAENIGYDPAALAGAYSAPELGRIELVAQDETLFFDPERGPRVMLYPIGDGVFYAPGYDGFLRFGASADPQSFRWTTLFTDVAAQRTE